MSKFDEFYSKNYGSNENNRRSQLERWESARKAREEEEEKRRQQEEKKRQQEEEKRRQESKRNVEIPKAGASLPVSIARIGSEKQQKDRAVIDSAAKSKTANLPNLRYNATVNSIRKGTQSDSVKNGYLAQAQIQREVDLLEAKAKEERTAPNKNNLFILSPAAQQNHFQKTETEKLLDEKKEELKSVKAQNKGNRINDIVDSGKYDAELEAMLAHEGEEDFINKYKGDLALTGYDAEEVYNLYKQKKTDERLNTALADPAVNELVGKIHAYERAQEDRALTQLMNPNAASSGANASTYAQLYVDADNARKQLAEMGYEPEELVVRYGRNLNQQSSEGLRAEATKLGEEHPVLGTLATFPLMAASGVGLAEVAKAKLTGREVDPNSPYFAPLTMAQTTRDEVSSDMGTLGKIGYGAATSIGDMLVSRLAPGGKVGYSVATASQAAAATAQQGAEKGYSTDHIAMNATITAAYVAALQAFGYRNVFEPPNAKTVKDIVKNVVKAFASEGAEEAGEEVIDTLAQNITSKLYTNQTEIERRVGELTSQGMSEDDAVTTAMVEIGEQVGTSFVVGGLSGGAIAGANSMPSYIFNRANAKNSVEPQQSVSDTENVENLPSQPQVATQNETVVPQTEEVETRPNTAQNADFEEVDDGDVSWEDTETDDEYSEYLAGFEQYVKEYDNLAADPTPEKVSVVDQDIKADYDSENYDGVTEDKVEPYTSGNPAVDALVNTNGRLDRVITTDEQAEQNLIDKAQSLFGRKVRFIDTLDGANAKFDRDTGEIIIARDSQIKSLSVFGHEFAHTLEGTDEYFDLFDHLRNNSAYIRERLKNVGNNWDKLVDNKITEYQNALGKTLSTAEAEYEIIADAVGEELFTNYEAMESLATQNRSIFTRLKQWFVRNFISTDDTIIRISNPKAAARKTYALMLRAEKAAMNRTQSGEGVGTSYSISDITSDNGTVFENAVVLDTDIFNGIKPRNWGKTLAQYVYNNLAGKEVVASDKTIIEFARYNEKVKKSGAKNPHRVIDKLARKTDRNSQLAVAHSKEIIEVMSPEKINSDHSHQWLDENGWKFYEVTLAQTNGDIFKATINVGKTKDGRNILYDINKIKRIGHGDVFSKGNTPQGTRNKIPNSTNSIHNSSENVNNDVSYSAKKSDTVQRITENFGYSDETANSIYKAARALRQNTASKADTDELAYTIATTLENRRNGNTDPSDAERIAMMIAEDAKALNEDFIAENKPIFDRLNGTKISISEADISDLGDAFSYVKGKLFPYVTLTKGEGISVDSLFQDLAEEFPFAFDADAVTHPADQVKAIMGFIEDYRNNKYYKPYFEDSEAFDYLRTEVENMLNDTNVDEASYLNKLEQLVERYGELKNGVPKSTNGKTKIRRTAASYFGSKSVAENPALSERYAKELINGKFDYKAMRLGEQSTEYLNQIKASDNVTQTVVDEYKRLNKLLSDRNYRLTPTDILQAVTLNPMLAEVLSDNDYVDFTLLVSMATTESGQISSTITLLNQFSGVQKLKALQRGVDKINREQAGIQVENAADAVADENGKFIKSKKNAAPKGVAEFIVNKKQQRYAPIKIPAELEQQLIKAKTKSEKDAVEKRIKKYVFERTHTSWFEKLNAWRYLSMLFHSLSAIRNITGNTSMLVTSRVKDSVSAGLSALPIAKKYKDNSVQTSAVKTTKKSRKAAVRLLNESDAITQLFSKQDRYTGRENLFKVSDPKINKVEQKIADKSPLINAMLQHREINPSPLYKLNIPFTNIRFKPLNTVLGTLSDYQQRILDDTPFKILRAKSVLSQAITTAEKNGNIKNIDDFLAVALNENTSHLDKEIKAKYQKLFDKISEQAAKEADEATYRDESKLVDKINKLAQGDDILERVVSVFIDGVIPFRKTPVNIIKRGAEYSPAGLAKSLTFDKIRLAQGKIDRNAYINNLAKGLTGSSIFALGALLARFGLLYVSDDDEEDKTQRELLGGQEYSLDFGDFSYSIAFLTPTALPLFMGGKVWETILEAQDGDEDSAGEFLFTMLKSISEPMFAQTMLSGVEGAFDAISRESRFEDNEGAASIAALNYSVENWLSQFIPSALGAAARTADDTVRTYYSEKGEKSALLGGVKEAALRKTPGKTQTLPTKLDVWGEPIKSGSLAERLLENFISPGYYEEEKPSEASKAIERFAKENNIPITDVIPKVPPKTLTLKNFEEINLNANEYEIAAREIGKARKEAVEKYLIKGEPFEATFEVNDLEPANKNGLKGTKTTFSGKISTAKNTFGWAPGENKSTYYKADDEGNRTEIIAAPDEVFRKMLYDKLMLQATEEGKAKAADIISKNRKNAKE